jgi:ABC-2 type transport system ATP-binding protein
MAMTSPGRALPAPGGASAADVAPAAAAVAVTGLVRRYGGTVAVDGLSFAARAGQVTAVLGPNGAGKTTTVECCEGLRVPDAGSVRVLGLDPVQQRALLRPRVGVMLQDGGLPTGARALEVLRHVAAMHADPLPLRALADRLGLDSFARTPVRRLSGGQRQRLALAVAVVGRPEVLFLDEPSAGLDPQSRLAAWDLVADARRDGVAVLLTTHSMEEAERLADVVVVVDAGRVVACGSPEELTRSSGQELRFRARPGLDLDGLRRALPEAVLVSEPAPGRYAVDGGIDARVVAAVTGWCADQGVMPEGLAVGRRTLEDVFLDLTGRALR